MKWYLSDEMMTNPEDEAPRKWLFFKSENADNITVTVDGASNDLIDDLLALLVEDRTPRLEIRTEDELRDMGLIRPKARSERLRLADDPVEVDGDETL